MRTPTPPSLEAGLGGRHDATNVLRYTCSVLTNVSLEHTEVLGSTRAAIASEKLAVVQPGATVVIGEGEWEQLALANGAGRVVDAAAARTRTRGGARLPRSLGRPGGEKVALPGRLEHRGDEIRDGAHTPMPFATSAPPPALGSMASILADKDVVGMLVAALGRRLVARSSNPNARCRRRSSPIGAAVLQRGSSREADPDAALTLGAPARRPVLVTGSLYLLADLAPRSGRRTMIRTGEDERLRIRRRRCRRVHGDRVRGRVPPRKTASLIVQLLALLSAARQLLRLEIWLVVRNVALFFAVAFWLASAYWVYKDARRIEDPWLIAVAARSVSSRPFSGRSSTCCSARPIPRRRPRAGARAAAIEGSVNHDEHCPVCRSTSRRAFLVCPVCTTRLQAVVRRLQPPLEPVWQICPFCETPCRTAAAADGWPRAPGPVRREPSHDHEGSAAWR